MLLLDYAHGNWMQQNQAWSKRHISIFKGVAHHIFQSIEKILNWKPIPIHFQQCERSELRLQFTGEKCKNGQFLRVFEDLKMWSNSITRQVDFKKTKRWWKTPKSDILMWHFGQFSNNLRQVKSNRTKNGRKCQRNFWVFAPQKLFNLWGRLLHLKWNWFLSLAQEFMVCHLLWICARAPASDERSLEKVVPWRRFRKLVAQWALLMSGWFPHQSRRHLNALMDDAMNFRNFSPTPLLLALCLGGMAAVTRTKLFYKSPWLKAFIRCNHT